MFEARPPAVSNPTQSVANASTDSTAETSLIINYAGCLENMRQYLAHLPQCPEGPYGRERRQSRKSMLDAEPSWETISSDKERTTSFVPARVPRPVTPSLRISSSDFSLFVPRPTGPTDGHRS